MRPRRKISWKQGCAGAVVLCLGLVYALWFFGGYVPVTSLPIASPKLKLPFQVCPHLSFDMPFPYYSPDGRYYVTITQSHYRNAELLRLYTAGSNRFLGSYSYLEIAVDCWAEDSSGIYIQDYVQPSGFDIGLDIGPVGGGDVKKALVPCQSSLANVPWLPRLYWELNCRIGGH